MIHMTKLLFALPVLLAWAAPATELPRVAHVDHGYHEEVQDFRSCLSGIDQGLDLSFEDVVGDIKACLSSELNEAGIAARGNASAYVSRLEGLPLSDHTFIQARLEISYAEFEKAIYADGPADDSVIRSTILIDEMAAIAVSRMFDLLDEETIALLEDIGLCNPKSIGLSMVQSALFWESMLPRSRQNLLSLHANRSCGC